MSDIDIRQLLLDAEDNANSGNYIESANLYKKVTIIDDNSSAQFNELPPLGEQNPEEQKAGIYFPHLAQQLPIFQKLQSLF